MVGQDKIKEIDVAGCVVAYLKDEGWDVYQEVEASGAVADIVAVKGGVTRIVEVKITFSVMLCAQAMHWSLRGYANMIHVAYPKIWPRARDGRAHGALERLLMHEGIGILHVCGLKPRWPSEKEEVLEYRQSRVFKVRDQDIRTYLMDGQKDFVAAGTCGGTRWTPWKKTCTDWAKYVSSHPGSSLKDCIENVGHHYASDAGARASMKDWIEKGRVPGITIVREGRFIRLYPVAKSAPPLTEEEWT